MSVINKMLRDLDKRGGLGPRSLEDGIRDVDRVAVAAPRRRLAGPISAAIVLAMLVVATAWYLTSTPSAKPPVVAKASTPVATTKAAGSAPAQTSPGPAVPLSTPTPSAAPVVPPPVATPSATPATSTVVAATGSASPAPQPGNLAQEATTPAPATAAASVAPEPPKAAPSARVETVTPGSMKALASESVAKANAASDTTSKAIEKAQGRVLTPPPPAVASSPPLEPKPAPAASGTDPRVAIERVDRNTGAARAVAEYRSANDLLAQGRVDAALARYADALRSDPRHVQARQSLVVLLLDQGKSAEAQNALREGVAAIPQNTAWSTLLARLQVEGGDAKAALETLERALPHAQGQAEYHAFLATLLQMQSRHREAITHYEASVRIGPESARWLTGLAISLEEEKRIPEARDAYRRALAAGGLSRDLETFAERKLKQLQ